MEEKKIKYLKAEYKNYVESADYIREKIGGRIPDAAIILGSGLGEHADRIERAIVIPYREIPNFPLSTVSYQKGELVCGTLGGKFVVAMNGRFHYYEGWEMWHTAYPIFVFKLLGIDKMIITNAAGGINESYSPGDLVRVCDHIKLAPDSPLRGTNIQEFGERFFDMQSVYDKKLAEIAQKSAERCNIRLHTGVYGYMSGPQYETPAEIKMLKLMGADLVGMSTVAEVIAAAQCKIRVLCISCVSNMAAGITGAAISEAEVLEAGKKISSSFASLITDITKNI